LGRHNVGEHGLDFLGKETDFLVPWVDGWGTADPVVRNGAQVCDCLERIREGRNIALEALVGQRDVRHGSDFTRSIIDCDIACCTEHQGK